MFSENFHVAVSIVGFRNPTDIEACVAALGQSTHGEFEILICENGGPAAKAALEGILPAALPNGQSITIIEAPANLGYAGGVNVCLRHSPDADGWWVLNPDTEPTPRAMAALVARFSLGDCDAAGGPVCDADGLVQSYGLRWRGWLGRGVALCLGQRQAMLPDAAAMESEVSFISGASLMIGRRFLDATGPMREDYFLYGEEVEWCLRARAKGMRFGLAPDAVVVHHAGSTTGSADDVGSRGRLPIFLDERNKILLTRDSFPVRLPVVAASTICLLVLRYARRGAWRQFLYGLQGWWAGLRDQRGPPDWLAI